ncbi:MAG: NPCBM/NEW2 domain-containing protein [Planctomycetota bacterium]|nr:NPCBM/NEW2 domain-containing protein [Planctomycetota bacterium]
MVSRLGCSVCLLVLGVAAAPLAALDVTVLTLEGEEQHRALTGLSDAELASDQGPIPLKDVAALVFAPRAAPPSAGTAVHLRNGDVLQNQTIVAGDDTKLTVSSDAFGELKLENKFVQAIAFAGKERPPADALDAFLKAAPPKEDLLLTAKGETISGYLEKLSGKEIAFNTGGQSRAYPFEQLAAFRLAPLEAYKPRTELLGSIELRDSSRITGKLLGLKDKQLRFEALNGQPWTVTADAIASITFLGGKLVYLSELTPAAVEEKPYAGGVPVVYRWRRDRAVTGGRMVIAGRQYERGIGTHSYSKLTYKLGGQFAKLLCDVGLDAVAAPSAVCAWKVVLDGKDAAAGTAKAGAKPETVKLDVTGAQQLELICDYGPDDDDAGDHLDWANARLLKP